MDGINNNWIALGFAQHPGIDLDLGSGRHSNNAIGIAWAFHRVNGTANPNQSFFEGPQAGNLRGTFQIATMTVQMVITLDTRDPDNVLTSFSLNDGQATVPATNIGSLARSRRWC